VTSAFYIEPTAVSSGAVKNPTYNDLAAILDAFNGSGGSGDYQKGLPPGWASGFYLSATEMFNRGQHAAVGLGNAGYVFSFNEYADTFGYDHTGKMWVALQVL
jgi:hypothetical protein